MDETNRKVRIFSSVEEVQSNQIAVNFRHLTPELQEKYIQDFKEQQQSGKGISAKSFADLKKLQQTPFITELRKRGISKGSGRNSADFMAKQRAEI